MSSCLVWKCGASSKAKLRKKRNLVSCTSFFDPPVLNADHPVGQPGNGVVVGNHHNGLMEFAYENIVLLVQLDGRKVDQSLMEEIVSTLGLQDKLQNLPEMGVSRLPIM